VDQIRESLDQIQNLSADELKSLQDSVISEFKTVKTQDPTPDVVKEMTDLANAAEAISNEQQRRVQQAADLAQQMSDAQSRIDALTAPADADTDADADSADSGTDTDAAPATDDVAQVAETTADTPDAPEVDEEDQLAAAPADADTADADPADATSDTEEDDAPVDAMAEAAPVVADPTDTDADAPVAAVEVEAEPATDDAAAPVEADEDDDNAPAAPLDEEDEGTSVFSAEPEAAAVEAKPVTAAADVEAEAEPVTAAADAEAAPVEETTTPVESDTPVTAGAEADEAAPQTTVTEESSEEQPVTAASIPAEGTEFEAPADRRPAPRVEAPTTIIAGGDLPGITAGSPLPNMRAVAQAILDRKKGMGRTSGGDGEQFTVATFTTKFPEERFLTANDVEGNRAKVEAVKSEALVAAGGSAAPLEVRYELFGLGDDARPVRDSLAVFGADRGGIRYITPPVLGDLNGSVSLWTLQNDIDAANGVNVTKPSLRVIAGAEITVYTDAIPLSLTFGNFGARAYPELVERHTQLGMIQHARFAETRLLTRIGSLSTAVTADKQLGAAKDILVQVEQAAAGYRNRHRMDENAPLRAIFPAWFANAFRADLTKQIPGNGEEDTLALAQAKITSWFGVRNINLTWTMDGEAGQVLGAQAAGALNAFPSQVIWYLFAEGTFLFLDGGTLDLGLVRDSTLNATNDYKIFLETFEGVAKVGVESLRVTSNLAILGASSGTVVVTG
jgi:chemotaxis protein histidine kinase CheA